MPRLTELHTETHHSALGTWTMRACSPAALAHVVESMWEVEGTVVHTRERIFPNGTIDLVTNLGPQQRIVRGDGAGAFATGDTLLAGVQWHPIVMHSAPEVHVFGIRLRPASASALLCAPMVEASGRTVRLADFRPHAARALARAIQGCTTFGDRVDGASAWIEERCGATARCLNYVVWMAGQMEAAAGAVQIGALRRAAGVSRKTIAKDFRVQVGTTPKLFARVLRFRRARLLLQQNRHSFADAAARCGYFDQAHMIREFRALGGLTPREFVLASYPDGLSATG